MRWLTAAFCALPGCSQGAEFKVDEKWLRQARSADDGSDTEGVPLPKQTKPVQVDAAPGKAGPKSGSIPNATTRRNVPGVTTVRPQKEAKELPPSDAPAGSQGQFEGERGRDDRGEFSLAKFGQYHGPASFSTACKA